MKAFSLRPLILILGAMVSIQFAASQAKQLFSILGVAGTSALRLFFASLMLMILYRPWRISFNKNLLIYGSSLGLMNLSFYFALERIPLGIGVALEFIGPLAVALFLSRKPLDLLWASLAGMGILLILPQEKLSSSLDLLGIFLALLAGGFWALYIIFGKRAGKDLKGGVAASVGMMIATVIVFPIGIGVDRANMLDLKVLPVAFLVALFGSALPYSLEMLALKNLEARTFGILMSLEPAIAAIMGFIFLTEVLTWNQWVAIICVIVSSLGSTKTQSKSHQ